MFLSYSYNFLQRIENRNDNEQELVRLNEYIIKKEVRNQTEIYIYTCDSAQYSKSVFENISPKPQGISQLKCIFETSI